MKENTKPVETPNPDFGRQCHASPPLIPIICSFICVFIYLTIYLKSIISRATDTAHLLTQLSVDSLQEGHRLLAQV